MLKLKRNTLSVALASAILVAAGGVQAQAASAEDELKVADPQEGAAKTDEEKAKELEAITVTGIRGSIERAINLKVDSDSIVEAISSEDIGKLPDISIADSITRLPGLAAQRVAGRASTISIRGFSGDYGTTLLNGREQVSVGDNRTVEFDQYPSELINQVMVYKTPDASLVGQGLSGTVDLRTVRPLMFQERIASVNVRGEKNSLGEINEEGSDYGNRLSAFYVDQFMDGNLGIALGYARLDSPGQAQRYEAWGFPNNIAPANGALTLGGAKLQGTSADNVRQGFMGVLEYNASENWSTTLDVYYSQFDKAETTRFMEVGLGWGGGVSLANPTVTDGVTTAGTFNGIRPVLRNDLNEGDDKLFAIGWNNVFTINEDWSSSFDLSHSSADREESILETYAGTRAGVTDSVAFRLNPNTIPNFTFSRDYRDPAPLVLGDPGGWGQDGYIKKPQIDDELSSVRLDFTRSFVDGMFSSIEFGVNYADREKQRSVPEAFLDLLNNRAPVAVDPSLIVRPVNLGHLGLPGTLSYNIPAVLQRYYRFRDNINADIVNKQWTVTEKITTGFAQANLNTEVFGIPLRGNLGFQAVRADQTSDGFTVLQGNAANALPFTGGDKYTDFLPSMNLVFDFGDEWIGRFGAGRQLARPRIDQMRANNNTSLEFSGANIGRWSRSGGNPELRPWEANAFDVSIEKYFAERGYVSLAYYYKDLRTYIFDQNGFFDARGLPIPTGYTGPTPQAVGTFSRPANGTGGNLKGWEFTVSVPFDIFTDVLEGFGIQGNHSDTSSSIKRLGPDGPDEPIAGLSDKVTNISLYYENYGFQARVGQRKRSDFLGEIQGFGADRALVYIDGETVTDVQIGYTFQEGSSLEGLSILLQVNNVTDEPYRQFFLNNGITQRYEEYGRQYLLGATYRF
ncbi:MAG: TonB-dependent receptor [Xanthomonadaceae bacterium]|nr:TonB-dependent receptor [Xanthomonadaceae bacterium]